jgi:hypothetical protein
MGEGSTWVLEMKSRSLSKAMVMGGVIGFFVFLIALLTMIVFPSVGETFAKAIGELPVPYQLLDKVIGALFGSHTDEAGILVVLATVCAEVVLFGAIIGCFFHCARTLILRSR